MRLDLMDDFRCEAWHIPVDELLTLVRRSEVTRSLVRLQVEESIADLVPADQKLLQEARQRWLGNKDLKNALEERCWSEEDLTLHLHRPLALQRFAEQRFGPGLEETFLGTQGGRDQIVYSLIRCRDASLLREIWIRLEEGEISFIDAATTYGEGPEAARKGVMGPLSIGSLQPPELRTKLRGMAPGEISAPWALGEWNILLRLEQLIPARLDDETRKALLTEQLESFLIDRIDRILKGDSLEPLIFDTDS